MKSMLICLLILTSLNFNTIDKGLPDDNLNNTENTKEQLPKIGTANPGEITFKIKILEVYENAQDVCGSSIKNVARTSVIQILNRGKNIVNLPGVQEETLVTFLLAPKDLKSNSIIEAKASESLCNDISKTYFRINSYTISK